MIEKGKISSLQMAIMFYPTIIATAILAVPAGTAKFARNDSWISPIWSSLIGFLVVYVAYRLHKLYPKQTIIQYGEKILGKFFGKVFGFIQVLSLLIANGNTARQYMELVVGAFLPITPMVLVGASLVLVCAFAVRGGVEVVGRASQLFFPLYFFSLVMIIVLLIPEFKPENILPIMENGLKPSLKGAVVPGSMLPLFFLISYILPYVSDEEKVMKWGMFSVFAVMLTLVVTNLTILFVFGGTTSIYVYPVLSAAKYISIADFFENVESIIMAVWVAGSFIKLSVLYYVTVLATAQVLELSDSRMIVFPIGFLIMVFTFWTLPNFSKLTKLLGTTLPFYAVFIYVIIPIFLLIIALIRKKMESSNKGRP